jgi:hypothetical protein
MNNTLFLCFPYEFRLDWAGMDIGRVRDFIATAETGLFSPIA